MTIEKDPVCGMESSASRITFSYKGKTYHFCSEGCKASFEKEPEKYLREMKEK
ncbi:MAG: YHS domain-containing protein [bacterium]|nr:YHS domain-containing protein [bacterium]